MAKQAPSYTEFKPVSAKTSKAKQRNIRQNTFHEMVLRKTLWRMGLRYRKNVETIQGKPDIVFPRARLIVFCDGDFWHGRNWNRLQKKLKKGANSSYWVAKIGYNIERDRNNTNILKKAGWKVVRFWETDIKRDPLKIANQIKQIVDTQSAKLTHGN